jgi:non-specific serine/threonine protein kinase
VLTVRRAIAMVGLDGVRRAALALRAWPGPLDPAAAGELERAIGRAKRAGRLALALRPAGYDAEVVYLVTLLQSVGRLVVQYHFADEASQIRRLMQPAPAERDGEPEEPGMSEEGAAFAVIGADVEAIGAAVARHWGLDDGVLHMIRRIAANAPVHAGASDDEMLRIVGSAANETIDALALAPAQVAQALQRVVQRYGRVLEFTMKELQAALQESAPERAHPLTAPAALAPAPAGESGQAAPGGLRAAAALRAARG